MGSRIHPFLLQYILLFAYAKKSIVAMRTGPATRRTISMMKKVLNDATTTPSPNTDHC
jgi:hypothetical protein